MSNIVVTPQTARILVTPELFRRTACEYLDYFDAYQPKKLSVVPYSLCCHAIELAIKCIYAETKDRKTIKKYGHNLVKLYDDLPANDQLLTTEEYAVLKAANDVYTDEKGFEYVRVIDVCKAYKRYPDLHDLRLVAQRIVDSIRYRPNP